MNPTKAQPQTVSLEPFRALHGEIALRDVRDLMTYPFFSLSKTKRTQPIDFHTQDIAVRVEGTPEHGLATIWDLDVLIWAASQLIEARDRGLAPSRHIVATPCEILRFIGRGTSVRDYQRLHAALDRLQSTTVRTTHRPSSRSQCFSWIEQWSAGLQLTVSEWFFEHVVSHCSVLTIDRAYFGLKGGIERWLYRLVRRHAGRQPGGWRFEFSWLYAKSGSMARFTDFACDLRLIARQQLIPGYRLSVQRQRDGAEVLHFVSRAHHVITPLVRKLTRAIRSVEKL